MDGAFTILELIAVVVLVLINGFFVAAEFALVKIRDTQLEALIAKGHRRAQVARWVINNLDTSLSAAQLGITVASLVLGWIGEPVFARLLQPLFRLLNLQSIAWQHWVSFVVGLTAITFLHIVVGEQAPKWLAIQRPLPTSLWVARPLVWFRKISYPFIWVLNHSSLWVLRQLGMEPAGETELAHSEEELRLLFATSREGASASPLGRDIVLNALDLRRRVVREVMRPRMEIVSLNTGAGISQCLDVAEKSRYSRFPLCEGGDLDKTLGVVHFKDLFAMRLRAKTGADLLPVARKLIYVPNTARLEKLLGFFLERKTHFAIVVDEYGGTVGMITLENILEELVGQIQDEFDQEKPLITRTGEDVWEIDGSLPLHELAQLTGESLDEESITTASGWMTQRMEGFPKAEDKIKIGRYELRVEEMDGTRVARMRLTRLPQEPATESGLESGVPPTTR